MTILPLIISAFLINFNQMKGDWPDELPGALDKAKKKELPIMSFKYWWEKEGYGIDGYNPMFRDIKKIVQTSKYGRSKDYVGVLDGTIVPYYLLGDKIPLAIFSDPFDFEIKRYLVTSERQFEYCIDDFFKFYRNKAPKWESKSIDELVQSIDQSKEKSFKFLIVYLFGSEKDSNSKKTVTFFSDKIFTRFRWRLVYIKKNFTKDGDEEKKYSVVNEGCFVISKIEEGKQVIIKKFDKLPDKKSYYDFLDTELKKLDR